MNATLDTARVDHAVKLELRIAGARLLVDSLTADLIFAQNALERLERERQERSITPEAAEMLFWHKTFNGG